MKDKRFRMYYGHGKGPRNTKYRKEKAIEQYLLKTFGKHMWHSYYKPMIEFSKDSACFCCGIKNSKRRIWVNVWGTCYPIDVCQEHVKFHGRNMEELPSCLPLFDGV